LDAARGAEVVDDAVLAAGRAGDADAAAVPDQQMREETPILARHEPLQVALDLYRVLLPRQPESLGQPAHVRVDDDPLRIAELRGDHVGRLPRHARQADEVLEPPRYAAVVLLELH